MAIDLRELEIELMRSTGIMDKWAESLQSEALDTRDRHIMTTEDQAGGSAQVSFTLVEPADPQHTNMLRVHTPALTYTHILSSFSPPHVCTLSGASRKGPWSQQQAPPSSGLGEPGQAT